jgi:hypothetical protein
MYGKDSLTYLLESCGFEILDMGFTGFPREHLVVGNPIENIVCLARPRSANQSAAVVPTGSNTRANIRRDYRSLGGRAVKMALKDALKANWALLSRSLMIGIIDRFPPALARPMRSALLGIPRLFRPRLRR